MKPRRDVKKYLVNAVRVKVERFAQKKVVARGGWLPFRRGLNKGYVLPLYIG